MSNVPLVDCHAHIWLKDLPRIGKSLHPLAYDFPVEDYVSILDRHGVKFAVLAAASNFGDYNDYMIDCLRRHPRLRGTVILKPTVERMVMEQMKRDGVVGIRLMLVDQPVPDLASFEYRSFLRRIRDLDWHVHLLIEEARLSQVLPPLLESGVKLVFDHLGRPDPVTGVQSAGFQSILRAVQSGRCWVKMSAGYRHPVQGRNCAQVLLSEVGPDRLVWASDCPFAGYEGKIAYQETIDWLVACVPDADARRKIFGETALGLYFS
jgi:predicted TIM-barrel fold metal-dependent hydrolase